MIKKDILSLPRPLLVEEMEQLGSASYRGEQVFTWLHNKRVDDFSEMTNLSKELRDTLSQHYTIPAFKVEEVQKSVDGTIKYLFRLPDGEAVETVLMSYHHGNTLCVSTQVGCRMGCRFCASTLKGLVRNLGAGEIVQQVYAVEKLTLLPISNVVLMGIGEPLDNFQAVVDFLYILADPKGKDISLRNITLSTCGLADKIRDLADLSLPVTLAISLHAPNDERRSEIMPITKKWGLGPLLEAASYYFHRTGRRLTFEYALIEGVNDNLKEAKELAQLLKGREAHVNLIPVNPVGETPFKQSSKEATRQFLAYMQKAGITTTLRRGLGQDISAACGQLRHEKSQPIDPRE